MASIRTRALLVKSFDRLLSGRRIERLAHRCGYRWRDRQLGPAVTIHLWIMQIVLNNLSMTGACHLLRQAVSAAGICRARQRLPLELLRRLNRDLIRRFPGKGERGLWHGHRVLGGDGVTYYTPDTPPLRHRFGSKKPFGYPLSKVLTLFELASGLMLHQIPMPHHRQEAPLVGRVLRHLLPGDVLILDRAFASFLNFCQALQGKMHLLIRLKKNLQAGRGNRRVIRRLGPGDFLVRWRRPRERTLLSLRRWRQLPRELMLRQVSLRINRRGFRSKRIVLITTLLDPKIYPADEVAQLYARRWELETNFRHLKQTLNLEQLRCKSVAGVKKELMIRALAYNLVRATMHKAAELLKVDPLRISFSNTLHWLLLSRDPDGIARLTVNPRRKDRIEPRRLKRQKKNYLPLNCSRAHARRKVA
jgi:hypothetical protein